MNKQPQITQKTRQKIVDAYWKLANEKGLSHITVIEVTHEASINRSTFYEYFMDIYDLKDKAEDELIVFISASLRDKLSHDFPKDLKTFSDRCVEVIPTFESKMFLLLGHSGDPSFRPKLEAALRPNLIDILKIPEDTPHIDYLVTFALSVILGNLTHWYDSGKPITLAELVPMTQRLMATGILGFTGVNPFA